MARYDGSLARKLDYGDVPDTLGVARANAGLRLSGMAHRLRGPDKYKVLERRRRHAQIRARRLLDLC